MSTSTKRACDACHRRKVRCNGRHPCENCSQAALSCTYDAVPQKKGPKGSRAKVISELRETRKQSEQSSTNGGSPPSSPKDPRTPGLLTPEIIDQCIEFFFAHMYPTMPILDLKQIKTTIAEMNQSIEAYCLLCSLAAFIMIQPSIEHNQTPEGSRSVSPTTNSALGVSLMEEAARIRKLLNYVDNPSIPSVITSFFLFSCCFGLDKHNTAWFHLREATALAQLLGMHEEGTYIAGDCIENSIRRRLFWLLFVTERAYALQKHKPLTLHATIDLPIPEVDSHNSMTTGFNHLVNLYRPFDDGFFGLWNKSSSECSTFWLAQLQRQLTEALPIYMNTTESQAADLRTSQQWLRTMVWQLSISKGSLSSTSPDAAMTFTYPIEIAKDLVAVTRQLPQQSMEIHGIGLIEKLFDVACTLIDVMSCVPMNSTNYELGPLDYLTQLINLISTLRGGESRYLPLIIVKIRETLPAVASSIIQSLNFKGSRGREMINEKRSDSSNSSASSSFSTSPFTHYYPLP